MPNRVPAHGCSGGGAILDSIDKLIVRPCHSAINFPSESTVSGLQDVQDCWRWPRTPRSRSASDRGPHQRFAMAGSISRLPGTGAAIRPVRCDRSAAVTPGIDRRDRPVLRRQRGGQPDAFLDCRPDPELEPANDRLGETILAAIDELPEAFRTTIVLVTVEGFDRPCHERAQRPERPRRGPAPRSDREHACLTRRMDEV